MNKFNNAFSKIISELIDPGMQASFKFPKLTSLNFKVFFTNHAAQHDADRNFTQGNGKWLYDLIDEEISKVILSKLYSDQTTFSLFTKFDDYVQIPVRVDFTLKKVTLVTIIPTLTKQRFERLSSLKSFKDSKGILNIPIKC